MPIVIPDYIKAEHELDEMVERDVRNVREFDRALKAIDEHLSLCYIKPNHPGGYGVKPGYWHIWRQNDFPAIDCPIRVIQTPEGGYREPDSGVLDELRASDLQRRPELMPKLEKGTRNGLPYYEFAKDPSKQRAKDTEDEQRQDQIREDFRAAKRVSGETGLRKRVWGRGGVPKAQAA